MKITLLPLGSEMPPYGSSVLSVMLNQQYENSTSLSFMGISGLCPSHIPFRFIRYRAMGSSGSMMMPQYRFPSMKTSSSASSSPSVTV